MVAQAASGQALDRRDFLAGAAGLTIAVVLSWRHSYEQRFVPLESLVAAHQRYQAQFLFPTNVDMQ